MKMRVLMLCKAVSPVSHASRTEGNEAVVNRQEILTPDKGVVAVPFLSGNALRHRAVRQPGATWLIRRLGLDGQLNLPMLNFLLHGGNLTDGGGFEDTRLIAECQRVMPLACLLGGATPTQILSGSLTAGQGMLVCRETRDILPDEVRAIAPERLRPAETFVSGHQYTRGDVTKSAPEMLGPAETAESNLMIFAGQHVMPGAVFAVEMHVFRDVRPEEVGALLWSLRLWAASGATIGGASARGHGRLSPVIVVGPTEAEQDELVAEYHKAVDERADDARRWLADVFAPRPAKEKKGKAS